MKLEQCGTGVEGNTKLPPSRQIPCKKWCFTWNNYTKLSVKLLEHIFKNNKVLYIFGKETGLSGTKHLQGYIECNKRIRPIEFFKLDKKIHWEKAKGSKEENLIYCSKEHNIYTNFLMPRIDKRFVNLEVIKLKPWQKRIERLSILEPDDRLVYWIYEEKGKTGKSFLCKYLKHKYGNVKTITCTKSADILTCIDVYTKTYMFDIPRSVDADHFYPWTAFEQVKNGLVSDAKLKKKVEILDFAPANVFVFANYKPDKKYLSEDKWCIFEIVDNALFKVL